MLNRVRAIIIKDDKLLTIKRSKQDLVYFVFPGGGVEQGEDLETAMKRECKEELGVEIKVIENFTSERFDRGEIEQLEYFYFCDIVSGELGTGDGPEYDVNSDYEGIHEIEWLRINDLLDYDLRPKEVASKLLNIFKK
jgi:8-oxo-dGTP diphosphatase